MLSRPPVWVISSRIKTQWQFNTVQKSQILNQRFMFQILNFFITVPTSHLANREGKGTASKNQIITAFSKRYKCVLIFSNGPITLHIWPTRKIRAWVQKFEQIQRDVLPHHNEQSLPFAVFVMKMTKIVLQNVYLELKYHFRHGKWYVPTKPVCLLGISQRTGIFKNKQNHEKNVRVHTSIYKNTKNNPKVWTERNGNERKIFFTST